jgi:uncharacterized protein (TIGR02145 family)
MKTFILLFFCLMFLAAGNFAQVSINSDGSLPDPSAGLDIKFNNKGILIPRLTYDQQRTLVNPAEGLMIFCIDCTPDGVISIFTNGSWKVLSSCKTSAPIEGMHNSTQNQIIWNWNAVAGATGYKWSTNNDFNSAQDMGTVTTKIEYGLQPGVNYTRYIWAYGTCGISPVTFLHQSTIPYPIVCGEDLLDIRDNRIYGTMKIGTQCWIVKNMNVGTRIDATIDQSNNNIIEKYCYSNLESNCEIYGGLYQWDEYMNYTSSSSAIPSGRQGICPSGWHVPSNAEYSMMTAYLGNESNAGGMMKETGYAHWAYPNTGATNSSGFTALPGGFFYVFNNNRDFSSLFLNTIFWTTTEFSSTNTWVRVLEYSSAGISNLCSSKSYALSARCIQD